MRHFLRAPLPVTLLAVRVMTSTAQRPLVAATGGSQHRLSRGMPAPDPAVGLPPEICCHTFRATGITAYLSSGGTLEKAQQIAAHSSPRTTKLYDRTTDELTLDEIEKIQI